MKTREELKKQQEHLLEVYEKVKDKLAAYPNVVNVGIGMKEKNGKLTEEGCIKIIVKEKKNEKNLDPDKVIPKEIEGVPTDVIVQDDRVLQAVCERDDSSYRPIKGGIRINNVRNGGGVGGSGTLGCLAQRISDDSWVILSNHHVLYGDKGEDGDQIGQPWVGCSWCCKTNIIAENVDKDDSLDCAIAKVKDDIAIENMIMELGVISGVGATAAINGEKVRKRGARTGLTSGTISFIDPSTKEVTVDPEPAGGPPENPGGCTNYEPGVTVFSNPGDSGSVYINDDNEVVALHYAGSSTSNKSFGNDIVQILSALNIRINTTSAVPGRTPSSELAEPAAYVRQKADAGDWIEIVEEKLQKSSAGRKIREAFLIHEQELFNLVNKHRPVALTWQRKQGPAFLAAFGRSVKHPGYEIPAEINRVSLQNLLMSMATILEEHGSEPLREMIRKYAADIIQASSICHTAEDYLNKLDKLDDQVQKQLNIY